ncbi:MAG: TonB-dependent receptor [Rhodospirillaceae bacterium]
MPNALISRVDIVTGGASAVYGSDALAGVVNFILDKEFSGVKGTLQGGVTTYGDDQQYQVSLASGMPFANGAGHFLLSGEHAENRGVPHNNRRWGERTYGIINNPNYTPTNGQPEYLALQDVAMSIATRGGLVLDTALRGTMFGVGGTPATFRFGDIDNGFMMSGGDWQLSRIDNDPSLNLPIQRSNAFTRLSYTLGEAATIWAEGMWAHTRATMKSGVPQFALGSVTVMADNPFIPASVRSRMTALGIPSFTLGTNNVDMPGFIPDNERIFRSYAAGIDGGFDAFGSAWQWDAYYGHSSTHVSAHIPFDMLIEEYNRAIDSVVDPAAGRIACRVNIDADPGNNDPSCVPYNPMGIGVNSAPAIDYVTGTGYAYTHIGQSVIAASASGEPFGTWAGPVSLALGIEHRKESVKGISSALDAAAKFFAGNYTATNGSFHVTEGFVETVVPLANDASWATALDLNGAVRLTDYSTSGFVTTWKVGAVYKPVTDVTLRATQSRDIRAGNLGDLFNTGRSGTGAVTDPATGITTSIVSRVRGNPNLEPEKADTTGIGVVLTPSFLTGFGASVDYYYIDIKGAIVSLGDQEYVDRCFEGQTELCPFIQRDAAGLINFVAIQPANILNQTAEGLDFEVSYRFPLAGIAESLPGELTLRALGNYVFSLKTIDEDLVVEGAGVNADAAGLSISGLFAPHLRYHLSATLDLDVFSGTITARGTGKGVYNNAIHACQSGCPASTAEAPTMNINDIEGVTYWDLGLNYQLFDRKAEMFFVVENAFNRAPPFIAGPTSFTFYSGQGNSNYDRLGRIFRAGVRFQM